MPLAVERNLLCELGHELRPLGPRADHAHVAAEDVPQLRQFVEARPPEEPTDRRDAGVVAVRPHRAGFRFGISDHRSELVHGERAAVSADARLVIEHRPRGRELHERGRQEHERRAEYKPYEADNDVDTALDEHRTPRLAKAFREDQPARTEVLDGDLSGELLVHRWKVVHL